MTPLIWTGCYDLQWSGFITKESFAHPAKYSRGLIERIFDYMLECGWLAPGDCVGDPFGGVATGGIIAAYRGLEWRGVELEERFVNLGRANINLHRRKLEHLVRPLPVLLQGDSRRFHKIVCRAGVIVTSPPFRDARSDTKKSQPTRSGGPCAERHGTTQAGVGYGESAGQIDSFPTGEVSAVITSPPFGERKAYPDEKRNKCRVEKLKSGNPKIGGTTIHESAGCSHGNISLLEQSETYWTAMREVYASCLLTVKPGGYMAVVIKGYVKKGQYVDLPSDTLKLLLHVGFEHVETIHAMLTQETVHGDLFNGEDVQTKSRKSFFRRLAEKKGSPPIDFEAVLFVSKPIRFIEE